MYYRFEKTIQSDIVIVKNAVEDILYNIRDIINENMFFNTKLILNELIINGVRHGNREDPSKMLNVAVTVNKGSLTIVVSDEGSGIEYKRKNYGEYDFCEAGRGLMLVEGLADKFQINGNTVTCVQYLK